MKSVLLELGIGGVAISGGGRDCTILRNSFLAIPIACRSLWGVCWRGSLAVFSLLFRRVIVVFPSRWVLYEYLFTT